MGKFSALTGRYWVPGTAQTGFIFARRRGLALVQGILLLLLGYYVYYLRHGQGRYIDIARPAEEWTPQGENASFWRNVPIHYPSPSIRPLPTSRPVQLPPVQAAKFPAEQERDARARRKERQQAVKLVFTRHWRLYRERGWDTKAPAFAQGALGEEPGGWAPPLLAALDTLWIMGMKTEFDEAVAAAEAIDFTPNAIRLKIPRDAVDVSVYHTSAQFLGGLLSAYDLSGDIRLLRKAVEVGDMLYKAFDTPNHIPEMWWRSERASRGEKQAATTRLDLDAFGGLSLEFTRLSLLTGDAKWFDAVQRVMEELAAQQGSGRVPGLWPEMADVHLQEMVFSDRNYAYSVPTMAASLAKTAALLGGRLPMYQTMYEKAMDIATTEQLFSPMTATNEDILMAGQLGLGYLQNKLETRVGYSSCALGASMAVGWRLFGRERDRNAAKRLVDGCIWTCKAWSHGVMPFISTMLACPSTRGCWSEEAWKQEVVRQAKDDLAIKEAVRSGPAEVIIDAEGLPQGFTPETRGRYMLRHEAIEGVFVLYRTTGQPYLLESAWDMFTAINSTWSGSLTGSREYDSTRRKPQTDDLLDPVWIGAALKYFYLIFSDPGVASLDDFVFNTEGHLFRRLVA